MDELILNTKDGTQIAVPRSLRAITTYVILEQEDWFEKELGFLRAWLRPGMTVLDIGANLGVYSLAAARRVGAQGQVHAFEPASSSRKLLEQSRTVNGLDNLRIHAMALSDSDRQGWLGHGASSELNALASAAEAPTGEAVPISSLDRQASDLGWRAPDFIKLDAEGEEERIIAGGRDLFTRHSPLVMFEIKAGSTVNTALAAAFRALGYGIYRLLVGEPVLVPFAEGEKIDPYELNLFAAKPDRAASLAADNRLALAVPAWTPDEQVRTRAREAFGRPDVVAAFGIDLSRELDPSYLDCLAAFAFWRDQDNPLPERCAALFFAVTSLRSLCSRAGTLARLTTLARAAWEAGERALCVAVLDALLGAIQEGKMVVNEPFWPASPRYDTLPLDGQPSEWFIAAAVEMRELAGKFSSCFGASKPDLQWLCRTSFASAEMQRRLALQAVQSGDRSHVSAQLHSAGPDNLNAEHWRAGAVVSLA